MRNRTLISRCPPSGVLASAVLAAVLAGCTTRVPAPVVDRSAAPPPLPAPIATPAPMPVPAPGATSGSQFYVVQRGDTLYSIARVNNLDLNSFLAWNGLIPGQAIREGQVLRLAPPGGMAANSGVATGVQPTAGNPVITAVPGAGAIQGQPLPSTPATAPGLTPLPPAGAPGVASVTPVEAPLKREPKAQRLPYSDAAYDTMQRGDAPPVAVAGATPATGPVAPRAATPGVAGSAPLPAAGAAPAVSPAVVEPEVKPGGGVERDGITWTWPTSGKVASKFSDKAPMKGIDITANVGAPVVAAAAGKVIYVGKEPRGYGQMIVVSHAKETVSVYFHTDKVLVKEQQRVLIGQKLAEVADGTGNKMHFEVRRQGRPIDPISLMPR